MKNKTLQLPPDDNPFVQHLLWANYQARIWHSFKIPDRLPNPLDYGYFQHHKQKKHT